MISLFLYNVFIILCNVFIIFATVFKSKRTMTTRVRLLAAALTAAITTATGGAAQAQRTADGSLFIGASQMVSSYSIPSGGLDVCAGGYLRSSLWKAGLRAVDWNHRVTTGAGEDRGDVFDHVAWSLYGGWRYRLAGTYSRSLSLYLGGDLFIGLNQYGVFRTLPGELVTGLPACGFIYGLVPEVEMEVYVGRGTALTAGAQLPVTLGSPLKSDTWNLTGSVGVRINITRR